jgi:hypothetical protein
MSDYHIYEERMVGLLAGARSEWRMKFDALSWSVRRQTLLRIRDSMPPSTPSTDQGRRNGDLIGREADRLFLPLPKTGPRIFRELGS